MHLRLLAFVTLFSLSVPSVTTAHAIGQGYVVIDVSDTGLSGHVELTLTDLDVALGVDDDGDGKVSAEEIEAHFERVKDYVDGRVSIGSDAGPFPLEYERFEIQNLDIGQFCHIFFVATANEIPDVLTFEYNALFDKDPLHTGFLIIERNDKTGKMNTTEEVALSFKADIGPQRLNVTTLSPWTSFNIFLEHGIWHIWIGFDHILFILALILPSVMQRSESGWEPAAQFRTAGWNVLKIVTLFTLAHSVTLTLASLDVVRLPSRLVESIIAASVLFAAVNNIVPITRHRMGFVVFGFGLFHGFGFASVLQDLVSSTQNLIVDLAGFNIGVEIGQVAVVAAVFPLCFALRKTAAYQRFLLPVGSAAIAVFALGWLIERLANIEFMPF